MANDLLKLANEAENVTKPFGETEVLLFYGIVAQRMKKFLSGRELAAKNWLSSMPYLIKRGSREPPLFIDEFCSSVTAEFLETRKKIKSLKDAKGKITKVQENIWNYFLPRKLSDFFYATNTENPGKPIDRIFFDLDRGSAVSAKQAQSVAKSFVETIRDDKELSALIGKPVIGIVWTGKSFHVFIFLNKKMPNSFYVKHFQYNKNRPAESFTGRWSEQVKKETKINVIAGHEKTGKALNIDPSQTPSGKLCRVPLSSLHMKDAKTIDGVSLPITEKLLNETGIVKELRGYMPGRVIEELDKLAARLPRQFL